MRTHEHARACARTHDVTHVARARTRHTTRHHHYALHTHARARTHRRTQRTHPGHSAPEFASEARVIASPGGLRLQW